jgi:hypothetical protein
MDMSIIIVSWNTKKLLEECLVSVCAQTKNLTFEIFVVDNASEDGTPQMVKEKFPAVRLIENKTNLGFAAANNLALQKAIGKYLLILNPDTIVLDSALEKAVQLLQSKSDVGILGVKTLNKDGSIQHTIRRDPTLSAAVLILIKLQHIFPPRDYYQTDFDYSRETSVEQIQGSFMLIRREVADKIGYFDEKFFIWFEEVDLCLRARGAGWKISYSPAASIIHYGGESFAQIKGLKKQKMFNRSLFYYFHKHKPGWQYLILRFFEIPSLLLTAFAGIMKRKRPTANG